MAIVLTLPHGLAVIEIPNRLLFDRVIMMATVTSKYLMKRSPPCTVRRKSLAARCGWPQP